MSADKATVVQQAQGIEEQKQDNLTKKMRKGFTLIELIAVVVIISGLIYLVYSKVSATKKMEQISSAIRNDTNLIIQSLTKYRDQNPSADSTYKGIDAEALSYYTEGALVYDQTNKVITSSGLKLQEKNVDGKKLGGCVYKFAPDTYSGKNNYAVKVLMDCTQAVAKYNWSTEMSKKAEKIFNDAIMAKSTSQEKSTNYTAKDIGGANAGFTTGGSTTDGIVGVAHLQF